MSKLIKDFVPNDVNLGGDKPLVNLITGQLHLLISLILQYVLSLI